MKERERETFTESLLKRRHLITNGRSRHSERKLPLNAHETLNAPKPLFDHGRRSESTQEAPQGAHVASGKSNLFRLSRTSASLGIAHRPSSWSSPRIAPDRRVLLSRMQRIASAARCPHFLCTIHQSGFLYVRIFCCFVGMNGLLF